MTYKRIVGVRVNFGRGDFWVNFLKETDQAERHVTAFREIGWEARIQRKEWNVRFATGRQVGEMFRQAYRAGFKNVLDSLPAIERDVEGYRDFEVPINDLGQTIDVRAKTWKQAYWLAHNDERYAA